MEQGYGMIKYWIRKIFLKTKQILPDVSKSQWYTPKLIQEYQEKELQKLIQYAYTKIPYYQKIFEQSKIWKKSLF